MNDCQKTFFYNQCVEREVNNGGFHQFYFNSSGEYAHEVVEALKRIGAAKTASIVERANDQFPEKRVPKDRNERWVILEKLGDAAKEAWEELDGEFFAYEDDLNALNMEYVKRHRQEFA